MKLPPVSGRESESLWDHCRPGRPDRRHESRGFVRDRLLSPAA